MTHPPHYGKIFLEFIETILSLWCTALLPKKRVAKQLQLWIQNKNAAERAFIIRASKSIVFKRRRFSEHFVFPTDHHIQGFITSRFQPHRLLDGENINLAEYGQTWDCVFGNAVELVSRKLEHPENLRALLDFNSREDCVPLLASGEVFDWLQEDMFVEEDGTSVLPVFYQLYLDEATVRGVMHPHPKKLMHGMITIYNLGERSRRMGENLVKILLADSSFVKKLADDKFPPQQNRNRSINKKLVRTAASLAEERRMWRLAWTQLAERMNKWFDGCLVNDREGKPWRVRLICLNLICDLPQIAALLGLVSLQTFMNLNTRGAVYTAFTNFSAQYAFRFCRWGSKAIWVRSHAVHPPQNSTTRIDNVTLETFLNWSNTTTLVTDTPTGLTSTD